LTSNILASKKFQTQSDLTHCPDSPNRRLRGISGDVNADALDELDICPEAGKCEKLCKAMQRHPSLNPSTYPVKLLTKTFFLKKGDDDYNTVEKALPVI
jgi:hypothetical protein